MTWHSTYWEAYQQRFPCCIIKRVPGGWLMLDPCECAVMYGSLDCEVFDHEIFEVCHVPGHGRIQVSGW